jgi:hypothetical protein
MSDRSERFGRAFGTAKRAVVLAMTLYPVLGFVTCVGRMVRDIPPGESTASILGDSGHSNHAYRLYNFGAWTNEAIKIALAIAGIGVVVGAGRLAVGELRDARKRRARSERSTPSPAPTPTPVRVDDDARRAVVELERAIDRKNAAKLLLVASLPAGTLACGAVAALVLISRFSPADIAPPAAPALDAARSGAGASASLPDAFNWSFSGTLSGGIGIKMTLRKSGTSLSGTVTYLKYGTAIPVRGAFTDATSFTLDEFDDKGKRVGNYRGTFVTPSRIQGTWTQPNGDGSRALDMSSADRPASR